MSPPTMATTLSFSSFLAGSVFFSAEAGFFCGSSAAADHAEPLTIISRTTREMPDSKRLVLIDHPPFDEHLAQLAARIEWVAGENQHIGRLARLNGAVGLVEAEQRGWPGRQRFERHLTRQAAFYQIGDGKQWEILGGQQIVPIGGLRECKFQMRFVEHVGNID